jgi:hypothetical protein
MAGTAQAAIICGLGTLIGYCLSLPGVSVSNVLSGTAGAIVLYNTPRMMRDQVGDAFFGDGPNVGNDNPSSTGEQFVSVDITTSDAILIDDIPVSLPDFQSVLEKYKGRNVILVYCPQDAGMTQCPVGEEVALAIMELGLPLGYVAEGGNTIEAALQRLKERIRRQEAVGTS